MLVKQDQKHHTMGIIYILSKIIMWFAWLSLLASQATSNKKLASVSIISAITSITLYLVIGTSTDIGDVKFFLICNSASIIYSTIEKRLNP